MFNFALILILIKITLETIEDPDFPLNEEFNIKEIQTKENISNIYIGRIMGYFKIKTENKTVTSFLEDVENIKFDFNNMNMNKSSDSEIRIPPCDNCNITELGYNCNNTCIEEFYIGYGAFLFIRSIYFSFLFVFAGTFMIFFGRSHYLFSVFFEFAGFLYFFVVDCAELFDSFRDNSIPFYIFSAAFISGFMIGILGNLGTKQTSNYVLFTIFKIIKACMIGYFFIKTFFYYISIFTPINNILYIIFLLFFIILGGVGEFFLKNKFKDDQIIFILSSVLAGSMLITKSIGYIVGGYFSDTMTSQFNLKYDSDAKLRVTFFLVFHIILIALGLFYQIMEYNSNKFDDSLSRQNSSNAGNYSPAPQVEPTKDINSNVNTNNFKDMSPKDMNPVTGKIEEVNDNDENEDLNDQDD